MSIFDRLFGKKERVGLDKDLADLETPFPSEPLGLEEKPLIPESPELPSHLEEPETPAFRQIRPAPAAPPQRDLELINSKLDTLKAILNSMDQRIASLEEAAGIGRKKMPW